MDQYFQVVGSAVTLAVTQVQLYRCLFLFKPAFTLGITDDFIAIFLSGLNITLSTLITSVSFILGDFHQGEDFFHLSGNLDYFYSGSKQLGLSRIVLGILLVIVNLVLFVTYNCKKTIESRRITSNIQSTRQFNTSSRNESLVSILHIIGYMIIMIGHLLMFSKLDSPNFMDSYSVRTFAMVGVVGILAPISFYVKYKHLRNHVMSTVEITF